MTDPVEIYECIKTGCTAPPTHVLRTDRLTTVLEMCDDHIGWAVKFFMIMHHRKVEPFAVALIASRQEVRTAVPVIKADLLHEAAERIETRVTVRNRSEENTRARVIDVVREMAGEATA
ncbi:MAG TPA: hypothetical protein VIU15_38955 [Streptomyces sp.]